MNSEAIKAILNKLFDSPNHRRAGAIIDATYELLALQEQALAKLEAKLDKIYTETERVTPPQTFNTSEKYWNDGFYRGQLKALELVSQKVFGKDGDKLVTKEG